METEDNKNDKTDKVYSNNIMTDMISSVAGSRTVNDLKSFKEYIESDKTDINDYVSDIRYTYNLNLNIYKSDYDKKITQVNPSTVFDNLGMGNEMMEQVSMASMNEVNSWVELPEKKEVLDSQYELVSGKMPEKFNEVVLVMDQNNQVSDYTLY